MNFSELLSFRKMITPTIIQIIYLVGLVGNALSAIGFFFALAFKGFGQFLAAVIGAAVILVVGSILIRVYCELLILLFKIYDELKALRTGTPPPDAQQGFPVMPTEPMPMAPGVAMPTAGSVA